MKKIILFICLMLATSAYAAPHKLKPSHKEMDMSCADCHQTKAPKVMPDQETCISCHGPLDELRQAAAQPESEMWLDRNPHYSFHYNSGVDCMGCHSEHRESRLFCNNCHEHDMKMPDENK